MEPAIRFAAIAGAAGAEFTVTHAYAAAGVYSIFVQVRDDDGGVATQTATITVTAPVVGTALRNGVLEIMGSAQRNNMAVRRSGSKVIVNATYGTTRSNLTFPLASVQRIVADLGSGDDILKVDAAIRAGLVVDAGAGNDRVTAGGGASLILGGEGNDLLYGGSNRDVLIGGGGKDQLWGYGGSDLVISGRTAYDGNAAASLRCWPNGPRPAQWPRASPICGAAAGRCWLGLACS